MVLAYFGLLKMVVVHCFSYDFGLLNMVVVHIAKLDHTRLHNFGRSHLDLMRSKRSEGTCVGWREDISSLS